MAYVVLVNDQWVLTSEGNGHVGNLLHHEPGQAALAKGVNALRFANMESAKDHAAIVRERYKVSTEIGRIKGTSVKILNQA